MLVHRFKAAWYRTMKAQQPDAPGTSEMAAAVEAELRERAAGGAAGLLLMAATFDGSATVQTGFA